MPEILLVHPGGPFWAGKNAGAWSIPKGIVEGDETALAAAKREFKEETGFLPRGRFVELGSFRQPSGKIILAWLVEGDFDPRRLKSSTFSLRWPAKTGAPRDFPEVDRAAWFDAAEAARKITKGQLPVVEETFRRLATAEDLCRKPLRRRARVAARTQRQ